MLLDDDVDVTVGLAVVDVEVGEEEAFKLGAREVTLTVGDVDWTLLGG